MSLGFCSECGKELQAGEGFCANCGHRFESQEAVGGAPIQEPQQNIKTLSKKNKYLIGIVAVIVIALFSAHTYVKSIISTEKQVVTIYEALLEGNGEKFLNVVHVEDEVIFDSEAYMELLEHDGASYLTEEISNAVQQVEKVGVPQFVSANQVGDILKVEKEKFLGIYNKVKITALAYEVNLETDLPIGKMIIGDMEWGLEGEPITLGRFLPGHYLASLKNPNLDDSTLEEDIIVTSESAANVLSISKDAYMVSLAQENEDSLVSIDGKETGKKVSEMPQIGPLFSESPIKLSISKKIAGEQQESSIVEAYPGDEVSFTFEMEEVETEVASSSDEELTETEIVENAERLVLDFRNDYEKTLNNRDFSLVDHYLLTDSVAYKELVEFVGDLKNENYTYDFTHNEATDWEVYPHGDIAIDTYEVFDFTNHKGQLTNYKREKSYLLMLDENGEYKIYNIAISDTVRE